MEADTNSKERCRLLELAPELRNRIYALVFAETPPIKLWSVIRAPPLLKTCRKIHNEAIKMYYATTTFNCTLEFRVYPIEHFHSRWLRNLPDAYRALIPRVRFVGWFLDGSFEALARRVAEGEEMKDLVRDFELDEACRKNAKGARRELLVCESRVKGFEKEKIEVPWVDLEVEKGWVWKSLKELEDEEAMK